MFPKTLSENTAKALALLGTSELLSDAYLAGGTALALQLGHRMSIDLDFFTSSPFESNTIVHELAKIGTYCGDQLTERTINGVFNDVKFSYFDYQYKLIKKTNNFEGVKLASCEDIAAMKLVAITDRGTKKDYIDLFFLAKKYSFEEMFGFYEEKYNLIETNRMIILKSMSYYLDADESPMPIMVIDVQWDAVKDFFMKEVRRLSKIYL